MAEDQKTPIAAPKIKIARCNKTCTYAYGGNEPHLCKGKCSRELGHFLNCKCRSHEMQ